MIKGIDVNQRIEFISKFDTEEPKTVFVIRPLNGEEKSNMQEQGKVKLSGTRMYDFLALTIVDIKNCQTEGTIREKLIAIKDDNVILELIKEIGAINNMTEQDEKNQ